MSEFTSANYGSGATTWTYDAAGNRSATGSNTNYTYDNLNRMTVSPNGTGTHSYTHDILGNRISRDYIPGQAGQPSTSARLYSWDVLNRMTATAGDSAGEGARYLYRADGMRAEKIEDISLSWVENPNADDGSGFYDPIYTTNKPTTRYWYDGQMAIEEDFMETSEQTRDPYRKRYGIGARGIDYIDLFVDGSYQGCQFPVYDGHGNMILTLARASSNGYSLANERYYDAWGAVNFTDNIQAIPPSQTYCANLGHVEDSESGLQYMRARYYEPSTGRFVSEDRQTDGWNWFVYASNEPVMNVDGSGNDALSVIKALIQAFLFFAGQYLLGTWTDAENQIARLTKYIDQMESILGANLKNGDTVYDLVEMRKDLNKHRDMLKRAKYIKNGQAILKYLGYAMLLKVFLMDIDFVDDKSGLDIIFGN